VELEYSIRLYTFLSEINTSQTAREAAKHVDKAALEAGKTVAVDDYDKVVYGLKHTLTLVRKSDDILEWMN